MIFSIINNYEKHDLQIVRYWLYASCKKWILCQKKLQIFLFFTTNDGISTANIFKSLTDKITTNKKK